MFVEQLLHPLRDLVADGPSTPRVLDPRPGLQIDAGSSEAPHDHDGLRLRPDPRNLIHGLQDKILGQRRIGIVGDSDRDAEPDVLAGGRVVDDVTPHDLVVGHDHDEVVRRADLRGPETDLYDVTPRPVLLRHRPQLHPITDLEGPVEDELDPGDQVGERVFRRE